MNLHSLSFTEGAEELGRWPRQGSVDDALALARRLLAQGSQADGGLLADVANARAANRIGGYFSNRAFNAEARRACKLALALLQRSAQSDAALLASIHNNLGQLDEREGDLDAAERHLETALSLQRGDAGSHPAERAFTADNLGAVLARRGQLDRAAALHTQALHVLQGMGPKFHADVATVLGNLGLLYRRRGDLRQAQACMLRAIDTHLRVATLESGDARTPLVNLISMLLERGDEPRAIEMTDWLLRVGGEPLGAAQHGHAVALLELGSAAFHRAQLGLAERIATRSLALLEASAGPCAPQTLRAVRLLANVHAEKGNSERAEQGLLRVLDASGSEPKKTAELLIDLGKSLRQRGPDSHPTAIGMFERAIRLLRDSGSADPQLLASALGNLAHVYCAADDERRADALYLEALAQGNARVLGNEYPWLLYCRALLHYHLAQHDAARDGMQQALKLWSRSLGASHRHVGTALANLALVQWARGDIGAAQRALARSQAMRASGFQRILLVGSERERLEAAYVQQGDLHKLVSFCFAAGARAAVARAAAELLLQRKACVLDALALTHARVRDRLDDASRVRLDRLAELRRLIAEQALSLQLFGDRSDPRQLALLQAEEDRLQAELSHAGAMGAGELAPVSLDAVQAALPEGALLVEYLRWTVFDPVRSGRGTPWRGARYAAMLLRGRGPPRWFDLGDAGVIDRAADRLRTLLRDSDSDTDAANAAAVDVWQRLIVPFEPLLKGASHLLVAPDGDLNLLPFGVLGSPMLGDRCVVSHLTSGRELLRPVLPAASEAMVHVLVDADFDADGLVGAPTVASPAEAIPAALRLDALLRTRDEAVVIASLFDRCRVLAGADASVAALKSIQRPALLHIATHGVFTSAPPVAPVMRSQWLEVGGEWVELGRASRSPVDNPMLHSGLALAGANRSAPGRPSGFITATELAALDLRGTELVVLSACNTGLGVTAPGSEFAGLRRAFAVAGAAAQVISLWEVEDDATAALMEAFYRRLLAGVGRAVALQQAQGELRRRPRWSHPSAWAAFVCWGAVGPLSAGLRAARSGQPS